jgi:hypothetical protein
MDRFYWVALILSAMIEAIALYKNIDGAALAAFFVAIGLLVGRQTRRSK